MRSIALALVATLGVVGMAAPAAAYVGPGAGLSLVGAFWGLAVAVLAALGFIILWPLRRLFRRRRPQPASTEAGAGAEMRKDSASGSGAPTG